MPVKMNDATYNRPQGTRLIDAPAVMVDIEDFMEQLKDESSWDKNDRNGITVFKTPGLTMVLSALHKGAEMEDLKTDELMVLQVIKGVISVDAGNDNITLREKQLIILHPGAEHSVTAEKESVILLSIVNNAPEK